MADPNGFLSEEYWLLGRREVPYIHLPDEVEQSNVRIERAAFYNKVITCDIKESADFAYGCLESL